ncbi:hypothetical protein C8R47DRAFT_1071948 [Mycena vitilis]|nr:hypothetical protein C8R47DRAFT_1071948 [Mycena vitilis]
MGIHLTVFLVKSSDTVASLGIYWNCHCLGTARLRYIILMNVERTETVVSKKGHKFLMSMLGVQLNFDHFGGQTGSFLHTRSWILSSFCLIRPLIFPGSCWSCTEVWILCEALPARVRCRFAHGSLDKVRDMVQAFVSENASVLQTYILGSFSPIADVKQYIFKSLGLNWSQDLQVRLRMASGLSADVSSDDSAVGQSWDCRSHATCKEEAANEAPWRVALDRVCDTFNEGSGKSINKQKLLVRIEPESWISILFVSCHGVDIVLRLSGDSGDMRRRRSFELSQSHIYSYTNCANFFGSERLAIGSSEPRVPGPLNIVVDGPQALNLEDSNGAAILQVEAWCWQSFGIRKLQVDRLSEGACSIRAGAMGNLARHSFFLPWIYTRCSEVEAKNKPEKGAQHWQRVREINLKTKVQNKPKTPSPLLFLTAMSSEYQIHTPPLYFAMRADSATQLPSALKHTSSPPLASRSPSPGQSSPSSVRAPLPPRRLPPHRHEVSFDTYAAGGCSCAQHRGAFVRGGVPDESALVQTGDELVVGRGVDDFCLWGDAHPLKDHVREEETSTIDRTSQVGLPRRRVCAGWSRGTNFWDDAKKGRNRSVHCTSGFCLLLFFPPGCPSSCIRTGVPRVEAFICVF